MCSGYAQAERSSVDATGVTHTIDTNAAYDAPLREKVHALIESFRDSGRVSPSMAARSERAKEASACGPDGTVTGE